MAVTAKTGKKPVVRGRAGTAKKKAKRTAKRTVMYSRSGKKLYAKRSKTGKFTDIQSYQRAHSADLKRTSKTERVARAKKSAKARKPAATATRKATAVTAVATKRATTKKVVRKSMAASTATASSPRLSPARIVRAPMTVRQIPRDEQSYTMKPKPVAAEPMVELAVPELAVPSSTVKGEVPAGGE